MAITTYRETFRFLTNLAYTSRLTLPILILCGFLLINVRISMELSVDSERVANDNQLMEGDPNDSDSNIVNLDEYSNDNDNSTSEPDSDDSHVMRTLICLDVEIDHFYPVSV